MQSSVPRRLPPAALVLSVLALLLASAAPSAHAQSEVILIGTVTVEEYEDQCRVSDSIISDTRAVPARTFGALSTTHFQHQSARREVIGSLYSDSTTSSFSIFNISTVLSTTERNTLKSTLGLVVGGRTYDFADTERFKRPVLFWWQPSVPHDVPPGWTEGARLIVKLVHKPAAPGGLTATPSYDEGYPTVALDWNDPADPMVGAYELRMEEGHRRLGRVAGDSAARHSEVGQPLELPGRPPVARGGERSRVPRPGRPLHLRGARAQRGRDSARSPSRPPPLSATPTPGSTATSTSRGPPTPSTRAGPSPTPCRVRAPTRPPRSISLCYSIRTRFYELISSDDFPAPVLGTAHECDETPLTDTGAKLLVTDRLLLQFQNQSPRFWRG